jgi:hypothetical protein
LPPYTETSKDLRKVNVVLERNLGNAERLVRFVLGVAFLAWAFTRPALNGIEWFVIVISVALVLNGVFARCYLWYLWDINTCEDRDGDCATDPRC